MMAQNYFRKIVYIRGTKFGQTQAKTAADNRFGLHSIL